MNSTAKREIFNPSFIIGANTLDLLLSDLIGFTDLERNSQPKSSTPGRACYREQISLIRLTTRSEPGKGDYQRGSTTTSDSHRPQVVPRKTTTLVQHEASLPLTWWPTPLTASSAIAESISRTGSLLVLRVRYSL